MPGTRTDSIKGGPSLLIDTAAVQSRIDARSENPLRWKVGTFHVPSDMGQRVLESVFADNVRRFYKAMDGQGWVPVSAPELEGPFDATDMETGLLIPGYSEWRVKSIFKHTRTLKHTRTELPPGIVKEAEDHTAFARDPGALKKAIKLLSQ